jgi:hypothetical protein
VAGVQSRRGHNRQGISIRLFAGNKCGSYGGTPTRFIFDYYRDAQHLLALIGQGSGSEIGRGPRLKTTINGYGLGGKILAESWRGEKGQEHYAPGHEDHQGKISLVPHRAYLLVVLLKEEFPIFLETSQRPGELKNFLPLVLQGKPFSKKTPLYLSGGPLPEIAETGEMIHSMLQKIPRVNMDLQQHN